MSFEFFLARRFLAGQRFGVFRLITTFIAIGGTALGVAALLVTLSIMDGFRTDIQEKILGTQPHVILTSPLGGMIPEDLTMVPRLAKMLAAKQEPSDENGAALARVVGSFQEDAAPALEALTSGAKEDESPKVRGAFLVAISQIASPANAIPAYRQGLSDPDASVRLVAAARLRQLGKDAAPAAEELAQGLEDSDPRVREAAAEALSMLGSAAVEPVSKHLDAKSAHSRQLAIACLGKLGAAAKSALPLVKKHLADADPEVKQVA